MAKQALNALAVVELADSETLTDVHGAQSFKLLHQQYLERLKSWVRSCDQSRSLGGNRFLAILKGVGASAELELAAAKLRRLFEQPIDLLGKPVSVDVHAGFVILDKQSADIKQAIAKASQALSQARKSSVLFKVYSPDIENAVVDEHQLVSALEAAVELGELRLYYQPKIHAGFQTLVGAEALMRWHTRDKKVLYPGQFIEVAERNSVIRPMTWWALKSAIARLARWPKTLSIAVNVTPSLLQDDEILTVVTDALALHEVTPSRLTVEVTEGVMIDDRLTAHQTLSQLRKSGVRVSIDDFGTGYSSLAHFRDLPADELKIDKGFVMPMLESKKDMEIVKAVIDLAHNFSLKVVGEGVENEVIAGRLSELGCDVLQGFAYDKPLPVEEFEKRYQVQSTRTPPPKR